MGPPIPKPQLSPYQTGPVGPVAPPVVPPPVGVGVSGSFSFPSRRPSFMKKRSEDDEPVKARFRAHLARVLDPPVAQALEATLSARPEKKKARPARK